MLLGDVLTVVALIVGLGVSAWGLFVGSAFLFQRRSIRAQHAIERSPAKAFWLGLVAALVIVILGVRVYAVPNPLAKVLSVLILGALVYFVSVGGSGLSRLIADRIRSEDSAITPLPAIVRGSLYIVLASAMPVIGTVLIAPVVIALSTGAALQAIFGREPVVAGAEA
jgi:hypothetical protein